MAEAASATDMAEGNGHAELAKLEEGGHTPGDVSGLSAEQLQAELAQEAAAWVDSMSWRLKDGATTSEAYKDMARRNTFDQLSKLNAGGDGQKSFVRLTRVIRVALEWRDLTYSIPVGRKKSRSIKTILSRLSSHVPPGRLVAIMGPTGCGKTSLVNALAGRLPVGGVLEGDVLVNGLPRGRGFRSISAYVMQDDVLFHNLTVRETFEFAAAMRLPASVSGETKARLVEDIITELGLSKSQGTFIGNAFVRGVSGGERKRTNIGIEMLANPSLIFLDEPTSGLDAFQALNVMESLWTLSSNGRSVISTIHQPRSSIYRMFDLLLLLSEGQAIYYGPASRAVEYFSTAGFDCPREFNPADYFLDVISMDYRSPEVEAASRRRISLLAGLAAGPGASYAEAVEVSDTMRQEISAVNDLPGFPNDVATEFFLLLRRSWKQSTRDKLPVIITLVQTVIIGFVLAGLYSGITMTAANIRNEQGLLFFICIFSAFGAMFGALNTFPIERGIVNRERAGKAYHVLPYYLARFITDMPLRVGQGLLFGTIVYWIAHLNPAASAFFIFVGLLILEGLAAQGLGIAISAGCKNEKIALALAPAITVILILFGGFYIDADAIPDWLGWLRYLSHLYYGFMGLAINNFRYRSGTWTCDPAQAAKVGFPCPPGGITGNDVLKVIGFGSTPFWEPIIGLIGLICFYNILGYSLLRYTKPKFLPLQTHPKKQQ